MSISDPAQTAAIETENPVVVAINAGGEALTQDGIDFLSDQFFTEGFTFGDIEGGNGLQAAFTGTVFQTERYGNFSYAIPVASTSQAYTVELRFGELWWSNPGEREFDVLLEGQTILDDLDIVAQTGSFNTPYTYVSGPITAGANGTLDLQFLNGLDNAKISGIVVRQATGATDTTGPSIGSFTVAAPVYDRASASVTVVYDDASGINLDSITASDLMVMGPEPVGTISLQSKVAISATSATATYLVAAPAGGWTDGAYTATVKAGEVADASPTGNTNSDVSQSFTVDVQELGLLGDFNGDGRADLALHNENALGVWFMNEEEVLSGSNFQSLNQGWTAVGTGDTSGDGRSDLLLQNGQTLAAWLINDDKVVSGGDIGTLGSGWDVAGMGDVDADGRSDVLLQNDQALAVWQLNGSQLVGGGNIGTLNEGWQVAGTGDLNGDGRADLLLQNGQTLAAWHLNGNQLISGGDIGTLGAGWGVAGMGDFDGNGRSDILLQNGQQMAIWQINGTQLEGGGDFGVLADGWSVSGLADMNGDHKTDILLQNGQTLGVWTMDGLRIASDSAVDWQLNPGWDLA